jgi:inner membrane protein
MDPLTHGLVGGALARSLARSREARMALGAGFIAGLLADADILIRSASDPLLVVEYHRHFTHSLTFIPVGALVALLLLWPFLRRRVPAGRLYLYCLAGFSLSGALDACTSYGTLLFWPFSNERVALNIIPVIDPFFTLVLLVAVVAGLRARSATLVGLGLCLLYLGFGFLQQQRAMTVADALMDRRGHVTTDPVIKPTLGNLVLWRSVYRHDRRIYIDAIRVGLSGESRIYEGGSVPLLDPARDLPDIDKSTTLYRDIQRFTGFSEGYVAVDPGQPDVIGDIRYSMLPMSVRPLWGLVINIEQPDEHADYRFFRDRSRETRMTFINMVLDR